MGLPQLTPLGGAGKHTIRPKRAGKPLQTVARRTRSRSHQNGIIIPKPTSPDSSRKWNLFPSLHLTSPGETLSNSLCFCGAQSPQLYNKRLGLDNLQKAFQLWCSRTPQFCQELKCLPPFPALMPLTYLSGPFSSFTYTQADRLQIITCQ